MSTSMQLTSGSRPESDELRPGRAAPAADRAVRVAATAWFVVAVVGQILFALYISVLYGGAAVRGDLLGFNRAMPKGYVPGDTIGNVTIFVHLALALLITSAGALQLVPLVRRRAPWLHRWVGRSYIVAALLISVGGLYLVWVRGTVGDVSQHIGSTLNASLIGTCGILAWRAARAREFVAHRRWAMRLFLVASGVWFFRVGLMLWLLIFRRPVGFDPKTFQGPFLTLLTFGESVVPLLVLELYFWAQRSAGARGRMAVAVTLGVLTLATAVGIFGATMGLWLPKMR
jgi:uncharacterized membrane protein